MRFEVELCHVDSNRTIVKIEAWTDQKPLGSSLGEGKNCDEAENNAYNKLIKRLNLTSSGRAGSPSKQAPIKNNSYQLPSTKPKEIQFNNSPKTVTNKDLKRSADNMIEDWSNELAEIDTELRRLSWSKQKENEFIENNFGVSSRDRIIKYDDIKELIVKLKNQRNNNVNHNNLYNNSKEELINHSDELLRKLKWKTEEGILFLEKNFNVKSRQMLSEEDLTKYNLLLEDILLNS